MGEPGLEGSVVVHSEGGLDASTAVVTSNNDVFYFEVFYRILKNC